MSQCSHEHFEAQVTVNRLEDTDRFAADVTVKCIDCDTPFCFLGLPAGLNLDGAAVSVDRTEARLAIAPFDEENALLWMIPGKRRNQNPRPR